MKEYLFETFSFQNRTIRVMVVKDKNETKPLPLLLMSDGQNLFVDKDASYNRAWNFKRQWEKHNLPSMVIVGVDCLDGQNRLDEYSPFINDSLYKQNIFGWINRPVGGKAKKYASFLVNQLLPFLKTKYNLSKYKKDIALGGSSMGGLFALYALLKHPNTFTKAACLSPSFWFAKEDLIDFIHKTNPSSVKKLYIDMGTQEYFSAKDEGDDLKTTYEVINVLGKKGLKDKILYQQIGGGIHNEASWEKRIVCFVEYLFEGEQ